MASGQLAADHAPRLRGLSCGGVLARLARGQAPPEGMATGTAPAGRRSPASARRACRT